MTTKTETGNKKKFSRSIPKMFPDYFEPGFFPETNSRTSFYSFLGKWDHIKEMDHMEHLKVWLEKIIFKGQGINFETCWQVSNGPPRARLLLLWSQKSKTWQFFSFLTAHYCLTCQLKSGSGKFFVGKRSNLKSVDKWPRSLLLLWYQEQNFGNFLVSQHFFTVWLLSSKVVLEQVYDQRCRKKHR